jgi:GT2 family glycosyltransferase
LSEISNPLVSVIILNYNAGNLLLNCVESVFKTNYNNIEIIVVDNDSKDHSHLNCKEKFDGIYLIENKENLGFCEGNNVGIRHARGEFVVILNPDTIVSPNWLIELFSAHDTYGDGLYQPKILSLYENNVIQSTGNMLHLFGFGFARDKGIPDNDQRNEIEQISYASGTCLFISTKVLKKIGLFDSFLFLYHDDLDLGWRAAQLGIKSYYVPNSVIYHAESYSLRWSSRKFFWLERNRRYCLLTHYSKNTYKKMQIYLIIVEMMVWIFYLSKGFLGAKIRAEIDIMKNKDQIISKYKELESKKLVSDKELIKLFLDEIFVPKNVSGKTGSKTFNFILSLLSKKAKRVILS